MLNNLPKIISKKKKRIGLGIGSGKGGHTSSRGMKGQKSRRTIYPLFEGTKTKKSLLQRLPLQRGKGKLKSLSAKPAIIHLKDLDKFAVNENVDMQILVKSNIISKHQLKKGVKVLAGGNLTKALNVYIPTSHAAAQKIKEVKGSVSLTRA